MTRTLRYRKSIAPDSKALRSSWETGAHAFFDGSSSNPYDAKKARANYNAWVQGWHAAKDGKVTMTEAAE
jgi:hypothetical protein